MSLTDYIKHQVASNVRSPGTLEGVNLGANQVDRNSAEEQLFQVLQRVLWFGRDESQPHTCTEIKLNSTKMYLDSKGTMRTPSIRASKRAST